jgi:hypothetical protein
MQEYERHFLHSVAMCEMVSSIKGAGCELSSVKISVRGFGMFPYIMSEIPFGARNFLSK